MLIGVAIGRITRDAELRTTKSRSSVCSFTVACNNGYGENKRTEFVKIVLFGKRADGLHEHLTKGTALAVEGTAKSNSWTSKSGEARGEIEIVADKITLLGGGRASNDELQSASVDNESDDTSDNYVDDDIPF